MAAVATVTKYIEAVALQFKGDEAGLEEVGQAQTFRHGSVAQGHEVGWVARAVFVVPDGDTLAHQGILGVDVGAERVVINAPVAVDGGLVAGRRGCGHVGLELGLATGGPANIAALPGVELYAGNGESSLGNHRAEGQHGSRDGLWDLMSIDTEKDFHC